MKKQKSISADLLTQTLIELEEQESAQAYALRHSVDRLQYQLRWQVGYWLFSKISTRASSYLLARFLPRNTAKLALRLLRLFFR